MIKLYNSLTKKIDDFKPLDSEKVRVYSCGPTVYDHVHIGNLSAFIYADSLTSLLRANGHKLHYVMNITDIDDKTIKRSQTDFPDDSPEEALSQLTATYETAFRHDIEAIGNQVDQIDFIKATDSIELMQALILKLYKQGFAYIADDGIYFSIEAYQKAGKKYGQLVEIDASNTAQARINNDEYDKQSVHDFALWKLMVPGEPAWSFEIEGKDYLGRPGWHIECSAMSTHLLDQPFDIHTGGVDLMFPHHENEIAQSTATAHDPVYAKVFMHNEHLLVENRKMSKSLDNFYVLDDILEHGYEALAFRLLILQGHYRKQSDFSWDNLAASQNRLNALRNVSALRHQPVTKKDSSLALDFRTASKRLLDCLNEDLNTPKALSELGETFSQVEAELLTKEELAGFSEYLAQVDQLFGLRLTKVEDIDSNTKKLIEEREAARASKDFALSDQLRTQLEASGIGVRDTPEGPIWFRLQPAAQ